MVVVVLILGIVAVFVFYLYTWSRVGRDPQPGMIVAQTEPPEGICPAAARFLRRMKFDTQCLVSTVVSLAVQDRLELSEEDGTYTLTRKSEGSVDCQEELDFWNELFDRRESVELDQSNRSRLKKARDALKDALEDRFVGSHFVKNTKRAIPGIILSAAALIAAAVASLRFELVFLLVWLSGWSVGVVFLARNVIAAWKAVRSKKGLARAGSGGGAVFITLFSIPFFIAEVAVTVILALMGSIWMVALILCLAWMNYKFLHWLKRPTEEGQLIRDQIEGFRLYLGSDDFAPPGSAPACAELFEKYLAYAMALGEETEWNERFAEVMETGEGLRDYSPIWYSGSRMAGFSTGSFSTSLGGSFGSAMASPSSSGSGGGGSSGGGGGGGGGGGW
jgi:uncharacterized membrane protein